MTSVAIHELIPTQTIFATSVGYLALAFIAGMIVGSSLRFWPSIVRQAMRNLPLRHQRSPASPRPTDTPCHPIIHQGEPREVRNAVCWSRSTFEEKVCAARERQIGHVAAPRLDTVRTD